MRSFVVLFVAMLLVTTVASGLMAFFLPFDIRVTRVHAVTAPVLGLFVVWHVYHNRNSLVRYLSSKHRKQLLAAAACMGSLAGLLYYEALPVRAWMSRSYEQRRADVIFRPSEDVITRRLNGRIEVMLQNESVTVLLAADLNTSGTDLRELTAIWMEDDQGRLLDTLYLSERLAFRDTIDADGVQTPRRDVLPVWWHRWQAQKDAGDTELPDGVDAVTGPTGFPDFDFSAIIESQQPRFELMMEIRRSGSDSQVYSAFVDLDELKRHYVMDLHGLGTERGTLSYDTTALKLGDLLVDKVIVSIKSERGDTR